MYVYIFKLYHIFLVFSLLPSPSPMYSSILSKKKKLYYIFLLKKYVILYFLYRKMILINFTSFQIKKFQCWIYYQHLSSLFVSSLYVYFVIVFLELYILYKYGLILFSFDFLLHFLMYNLSKNLIFSSTIIFLLTFNK